MKYKGNVQVNSEKSFDPLSPKCRGNFLIQIKIRYTNFHFLVSDSLLDILDLIFYY